MSGESLLTSVAIGTLSSVAASIIWLLALRRVKPRIDVSPSIAEDGRSGSRQWRVNIINRSSRAVVDLRVELVRVRSQSARNGSVNMTRSIDVGRVPLTLAGRRRGSTEDNNCFRMRIYEDPGQLLSTDDGRYIRLRIFGRDEITGVGSLVETRYTYAADAIKQGRFSKGQSFDIS